MEKQETQPYEGNLEHLEALYRQLVVELIHQAGKDWYPQNPELFRVKPHQGFEISYEDAVLLQAQGGNHSLLKIEAAVMDYLLLPLHSYPLLSPQLKTLIANGDQLSVFSPRQFETPYPSMKSH